MHTKKSDVPFKNRIAHLLAIISLLVSGASFQADDPNGVLVSAILIGNSVVLFTMDSVDHLYTKMRRPILFLTLSMAIVLILRKVLF